MEGYVFEWINFIKGWRTRYLMSENQFLFISHQKSDNKRKQIELSDSTKLIDDKKKKFSVDLGKTKIYFKAKSIEEKDLWIEKIKQNIANSSKKPSNKNLDEIIINANKTNNSKIGNNLTLIKIENENKVNSNENNLNNNNNNQNINNNVCLEASDIEKKILVEGKTSARKVIVIDPLISNISSNNGKNLNCNLFVENENTKIFSKCYKNYQEIIENEYFNSTNNNLDKIIYSFKNLQNLFFEYNINLENFNQFIQHNNKSKDAELKSIFDSFYCLKSEIKSKFDDCIKNFYEFKDNDTNNKYINQAYLNFSEITLRERSGTEYFEALDFNEIINSPDTNKKNFKLIIDSNNNNNNVENFRNNANLIELNIATDLNLQDQSKLLNEQIDFNVDLNKVNNVNNEIDEYNADDNSFDSYEECNNTSKIEDEELKNIKSSLEKTILKQSIEKKQMLQRSFSFSISDFHDPIYNFTQRKNLPFPIKCSTSMVSDMLKSLAKEKVSLPINYNEPLSMLQKQCEKFFYCNLLHKAGTTSDPYLKLAYICAFVIADVSTNLNRILKPFNPILGETFEFFDNSLKYRYFSEQVSHNPPISAFICESDNFVFFGDSRSKNKFSFFKGSVELNFLNKYNLILKNFNDHFVFNKPDVYMKGLVFGTPHYDFKGLISVSELNKKEASAVIEFFEEGKKAKTPGYFEGKILDSKGEIVFLLKGKCDENLFITKKDGSEKTLIWEISEGEEFWRNSDYINNYLISTYACNLNYLPEKDQKNLIHTGDKDLFVESDEADKAGLTALLPKTDSRFRKDQRLVENRKMDLAAKEKERLEELQRKRHKFFEEKKIKYTPNYFNEVYDEKSAEFIYIFNGQYWEDRKTHSYEKLHDIFENENSQV